jgi:hypothetical protein
LTDDVMSKSGKSTKLNGNDEDPTNLETESLTTLSGDNEQGATDVDMEPDNVFEICYGKMLQTFWPSITAFIESYLEHDHSKQWNDWINSGLNYATDLAHFKMLLGTESLDQIFLFLRDSPVINQDFELVWNHKINYRTRHSTPTVDNKKNSMNKQLVPEQMAKSCDSPLSIHNLVTGIDTVDFGIFHKLVYEAINKWAATESAKQNEHWISWIKLT